MEKQDYDYGDHVPVALVTPETQEMSTGLEPMHGITIRQVTQADEVLAQVLTGLPFERANKYKITSLDPNLHALKFKTDPAGWKPTATELDALPTDLFALEKSSFGQRFLLGCMGCLNLRPLTMTFTKPDGQIGFEVDRKFRLGGCLCCPHETFVRRGDNVIGKIEEDWHCGKNYCLRCCQQGCCCMNFYDLKLADSSAHSNDPFVNRFHMNINICCFGAHNNCCGATPCFNDMLWNIYSYETNDESKGGVSAMLAHPRKLYEPVGHFQKTYGGGSCSLTALCRCCFNFNNYIMEFPEGATAEEKALLVGGFVHTEYLNFEESGQNN